MSELILPRILLTKALKCKSNDSGKKGRDALKKKKLNFLIDEGVSIKNIQRCYYTFEKIEQCGRARHCMLKKKLKY